MKRKFKYKFKKGFCMMLVALVLIVGVGGSYTKANTVHATGIEEAMLIPVITALLTSLGIVVTQNTFDGTSARAWLDEAETLYEEERFKLIQGGANLPPDNNHNDEDGDGDFDSDDVKTFQELVQPNVKYQLVFNKNVAMCLSTFSVWAYDKLYQLNYNPSSTVSNIPNVYTNPIKTSLNFTTSNGYKYSYNVNIQTVEYAKSSFAYRVDGKYEYVSNVDFIGSVMQSVNNGNATDIFTSMHGNYTSVINGISYKFYYLVITDALSNASDIKISSTLYPTFPTLNEAILSVFGNIPVINKDTIWVHPDIQNTFVNDGTFQYPIPPSNPINIPDIGLLSRLYNALKNPDIPDSDKNQLLKDYINNIDNNPDQVPVPIPSATVDINPDSFPEPLPTVDPTPDNDPTNDPSSPTVDKPTTDEPSVDSGTVPKLKLRALLLYGLQKFFPFCIPWDLIHAFKLLGKSAETPHFEIPFKIASFGIDEMIVIDFGRFELLGAIARTLETLLFIIGLILVTRNLIKG